MARLELERGTDVLLLETGDALLLELEKISLAGSLTPAGTLAPALVQGRSFAGTVETLSTFPYNFPFTFSRTGITGQLNLKRFVTLSGSITPSGDLEAVRFFEVSGDGSITATGILEAIRITVRSFGGSITPTGALDLIKTFGRSISGSLSATGALDTEIIHPRYKFLIDWDGDGTFGGVLDNVGGVTLSARWRRGRDFASQLTGRSVAGNLTAVLRNDNGSFSPFNSDSPIFGSALPGRRVNISGTLDGTAHTLWSGFLKRLVPSPDVKGLNVAILEAVGALGEINRQQVAMPMVTDMLTGSAIGTLLGSAGWTDGTALDDGQTTLTRFWVDKQNTINALRLPEETEAGFIVETKDGTIAFEDRHHRLKSPHTASVATFTDSEVGTLVYIGIQQEDPLPNIFNVLEAEVRLFNTGTGATLWTMPETGTNTKIERDGGTRTWWAAYPNPDSQTDAFAVDSWDDLTTADYTFNSDPSGTGGADLTSDIAVSQGKFANSQKLVFTNNNTTADAYLADLKAPGTGITRSDPVRVTAEDETSKTKFGPGVFPNPAQFLPDTDEAQKWADFHLSIYKDPLPIIAITVLGNKDGTHLAQVFQRDISDRITIVGTNRAGLGVNEDFFIEAEMHELTANLTHRVTYECSQAAKFSGFWALGSSRLGISTRLSY